MKTLELCSGSGIFSEIARQRGHKTITVDIDPDMEPDLVKSVIELEVEDLPYSPEAVIGAPPCPAFSLPALSHGHFKKVQGEFIPQTREAFRSIEIVKAILSLIDEIDPKYFIIENPRGLLRKMEFMQRFIRKETWYCQYQDHLDSEEKTPKPEDLFVSKTLAGWNPPACHYGNKKCHGHIPRGFKDRGTQSKKNAYERAKFPRKFCIEILEALESEPAKQMSIGGVKA